MVCKQPLSGGTNPYTCLRVAYKPFGVQMSGNKNGFWILDSFNPRNLRKTLI